MSWSVKFQSSGAGTGVIFLGTGARVEKVTTITSGLHVILQNIERLFSIFSGSLPRFSKIFTDFSLNFTDFVEIFDCWKLLEVAYACAPTSYTSTYTTEHEHLINDNMNQVNEFSQIALWIIQVIKNIFLRVSEEVHIFRLISGFQSERLQNSGAPHAF